MWYRPRMANANANTQAVDGRASRSENTRAALLRAAAREFADKGYSGTRLATICRAAKAGKG